MTKALYGVCVYVACVYACVTSENQALARMMREVAFRYAN